MNNQSDISPAAIVHALQSAPTGKPAQVDLVATGTATIAACRNPYRRGFAVVVVSGGDRYGVTGFKTTPNQSGLTSAIATARDYITRHAL